MLSEFRDRLAGADAGLRLLDSILTAARDKGLLKSAGQARTDSTHVLSAAREMCWLEMVSETLRSALNALALAAPNWLATAAEPDWFRHYSTRAEDSRFPRAKAKRAEAGQRIGADGTRLLQAVSATDAPSCLQEVAEVEILRQVWVQHFHQVEGEVRRQDPKDRPPGATRLVTPSSMLTSPKHPGPAPAPATSQHFAPPTRTRSTVRRRRRARELTNSIRCGAGPLHVRTVTPPTYGPAAASASRPTPECGPRGPG